jgi:AcrR family transcriptional regulator
MGPAQTDAPAQTDVRARTDVRAQAHVRAQTGAGRVPRWQRLGHDERRRQILSCARRLFSERPYASVSTTELAREAGVARGLLHHYFGSKRDLYLEVVRSIIRMPANPVPLQAPGRGIEVVIDESVDRWLTMLDHNRGTWLTLIGGRGLGRDPELEEILEEAREQAADRLIEALQTYEAARAPTELRAAVRAYSGFAESASIEWLERGRLTREQLRVLLVQAFLSIVRDVVPAVQTSTLEDRRLTA